MKRFGIYILAMLLLFGGLSGCTETERDNGELTVVCTNFSLYDWAREVIGELDGIRLILLADSGRDFHSYEPSAKDMMTISSCDVFIGVGGNSESWLADYLKTSMTVPKKTLLLMEEFKEDLLKEPSVTRDEHDHEATHGEYDEHIWLSPRLAKKACEAIYLALAELDDTRASRYRANFESYAEELDALSVMFENTVANATAKTLIFADRYPFCYLLHEYGLSAYAAFPGCSSESEASFETVTFLAQKVDELALPYIFAVSGSDLAVAKTVAASVKGRTPEILILDSLETVSNKEKERYWERMKNNAEVLMTVFGK